MVSKKFFLLIMASALVISSLGHRHHKKKGKNRKLEEGILKTSKAINQTLDYLTQNPDQVSSYVVLSVMQAKMNLQWSYNRTEKTWNIEHPWLNILKELMEKCDNVVNAYAYQNQLESSGNTTESLLPEENFLNDTVRDLKFFELRPNEEFVEPDLANCSTMLSYLNQGTPMDSKKCLDELAESNCMPSDECWHNETDYSLFSGYKTLQRLMYIQATNKLDCKNKNPEKFWSVNSLKRNLCGQMLEEANAISSNGYPPAARDLFLQQISLCGMEGYIEFANCKWNDDILKWQAPEGCFARPAEERANVSQCLNDAETITDPDKTQFESGGNSSSSVENNCSANITGNAVSALAFQLRSLIESYFLKIFVFDELAAPPKSHVFFSSEVILTLRSKLTGML